VDKTPSIIPSKPSHRLSTGLAQLFVQNALNPSITTGIAVFHSGAAVYHSGQRRTSFRPEPSFAAETTVYLVVKATIP
jgi:hypothetical protein